MKKTILLSSILAVGAAFAGANVPSTEVGVMGVKMPTKAALIAVPFLGYNDGDIVVADMVNTAELEVDSKLYVPNNSGKYDVWTLDTNKRWQKTSSNVVIGNDGTESGEGANANTVTTKRGGSFWLEPAGTPTGNCYLLGKPGTTAGSSSIVSGSPELGVWNLIGNTAGEAKPIPAGVEGEKVCVPNTAGGLDTYTYRKKVDGWAKEGERAAVTVTIKPGQGFWYLSKGTPSIAW